MDACADRDRMVAQLALLMDPAGRELLDALPPYRESETMGLSSRLRSAGHSPDLIAAALTQSKLRARAAAKLGPFAESMLLTPAGLEQASRLAVAAHHAQRFRGAGIERVADLGCGIGGDALALAGLGLDVTAVDADEMTAAVATVNLAPFPTARVELSTAEEFDVSRVDGVWLDPARRDSRGRIHDPEAASPPLSFVLSLRGTVRGLGAKLSPAIDHAHLPDDCEAQWVSDHGEVVEAVLWHGEVAVPGVRRSALVLDGSGPHVLSDADRPDGAGSPQGELGLAPVGRYLIEPDGAVLRAGLLDVVAERWDAHQVDPTIAYLTGDRPADDAFGRSFAVRDVLPFGMKALTAYLRARELGVLEIKKRGTAVEPDELRKKLKPRRFGEKSATLILTRAAGHQVVIVADPVAR